MNSAWATLEKVNSTDFLPGDKMLFEGRQTFSGKLTFISKSGTAGNLIIVSSYGSGRATINGGEFSCDSITDFTTWANDKDKEKVNGVIVGMNSDPLLNLPTDISLNLIDPTKLKTLTQFILQANSPCTNKGLNLKQLYNIDSGKYDFFGNSIQASKTFNIGPYEH